MKNVKDTVAQRHAERYPVKVLQIGEGNFLRAFADWLIDKLNDADLFHGSVVLCQPLNAGMAEQINKQNGVYTVLMRGVEDGKTVEKADVVTSVSRCINPYADYAEFLNLGRAESLQIIISNTTEAGIAYHEGDKPDDRPPFSYPAKLTALLYERYKAFGGSAESGLLILPVELIERNGDNLKACVLRYAKDWSLPEAFFAWLESAVSFANTLVDRIVTGYPRDEAAVIWEKLGYEDNLLDTCEPFHTWVIEAPKKWSAVLPFEQAGLHVIWTDDMTPYRTRKVRILNGAHTLSVLAAYLSGHDIVLEMMRDERFSKLIHEALWKEIIPNIDLPRAELDGFASAVLERFSNPFIKHRLLDISLNSVSKFKARCLDSLLESTAANGKLPPALCFGLAALIAFYKGTLEDGHYYGTRNGERYEIRDSADVLAFFASAWKNGNVAQAVLQNTAFWGRDLTKVDGLLDTVSVSLDTIETDGIDTALGALLERIA